MGKRETFKDRNSRVLGYIETLSDGSQQAMDPGFTIIGHYNRRKDVTQDVHFQTLSKGNTLIKLVDPNSLAEM